MTPAIKASARYWLAGIALAIAGVAISRLLAPEFQARSHATIALIGQLLALSGLWVIIMGIRRRLRSQAVEPPTITE
ncbi:MAG: hypothetical protein WC205_04865 [Opitutaceae bacterium]|jgi:uncharacterized membrane protein YidH (DUF202 family)